MTDGPAWLDELPLDPGPPHLRLGIRRIPESAWLLPDDQRAGELALKADLLARRRPEIVAVAEEGRDSTEAQGQALALVTDWLRRYEPTLSPASAASGDGVPDTDSSAGEGAGVHHAAPDLEAAARLVQEDLCLMAMGDGPPVLTAAVLCFPSHWRLSDKIGRPMAAIHEPVSGYAEDLGHRPDHVLEHLAGDRIVARRNWLVHDGGDLFAPSVPAEVPLSVDEVPERLWLRSERQTLRRLPAGDHVLFTIRVQRLRFDGLRSRPDVAARLAAAVRAEAPDGSDRSDRFDRFAGGQVAPLLAWLDGLDT